MKSLNILPARLRLALTARLHTWAVHRMWSRPADKWIGHTAPDGAPEPVMWTWRVFKLWKLCAIELHSFVASDPPECFHTHPTLCFRWVLDGGYTDVPARAYTVDNPHPIRAWHAGDMGLIAPSYGHRIQLHDDETATTLWITGPRIAPIRLVGEGWKALGIEPGISPIEKR